MNKKEKFQKIIDLSIRLKKAVSWVASSDEEKGLENLVIFFQQIYSFKEEWDQIFSIKVLFKMNPTNNDFIIEMRDLFGSVEVSEKGWNRTEENKIPSQNSIFVCPTREMMSLYEEENIKIRPRCVSELLIKKFKISKKEEEYPGQFEQEVEIMNEISIKFMKDFQEELDDIINNFNYI